MVSRRSAALLLVLLQFSIAPGFAQDADIVISEFMAVNSSTLADEDGDSSDWVEVHNQGFSSVDIDGWYLTDDDNDLDRWRFPSVTLDGGGRLLVFASGKDRRDAAGELHTSFRLAGDGEFLALVRPDGDTIAHAYAPQYPRQRPDISYGVGRDLIVEALAPARSSARVLIPQNDTLGTTWTGGDEPFDDSSWIDGTTGVGYLNSQPGFATRVIIPGGDVSSLATAEDVASDPTPGGQFSGEIAAVVNYYNTGGRGHHLPLQMTCCRPLPGGC